MTLRAALLLAALLLAPGSAAHGQTPPVRLAVLGLSDVSLEGVRRWVVPALAALGLKEGAGLVLDMRAGPQAELDGLARALLAARPTVVITVSGSALVAMRAQTAVVPIISFGPDPVLLGLAATLAQPGGNVTGVTIASQDLEAKRLSLLAEAMPGTAALGALLLTASPGVVETEARLGALAGRVGIRLRIYHAATPAEYAAVMQAAKQDGVAGLLIGANLVFARDAARIIQAAGDAGLATICEWADMTALGCMIGYGPDRRDLHLGLAGLLVRVLRGTPPAELPIQQPTTFEYFINQQTARRLGLTLPASVLIRADQVIE